MGFFFSVLKELIVLMESVSYKNLAFGIFKLTRYEIWYLSILQSNWLAPIPPCHMSVTKRHLRNYISGNIFCKNCIVSWNMMKSEQSVSNWTHESTEVAKFPHNFRHWMPELMAADATYTLVWFYWVKHAFKCRKMFVHLEHISRY